VHVCVLIRLHYAQRERRLVRWRCVSLRFELFSSSALILDRCCIEIVLFSSAITGESYNFNHSFVASRWDLIVFDFNSDKEQENPKK